MSSGRRKVALRRSQGTTAIRFCPVGQFPHCFVSILAWSMLRLVWASVFPVAPLLRQWALLQRGMNDVLVRLVLAVISNIVFSLDSRKKHL